MSSYVRLAKAGFIAVKFFVLRFLLFHAERDGIPQPDTVYKNDKTTFRRYRTVLPTWAKVSAIKRTIVSYSLYKCQNGDLSPNVTMEGFIFFLFQISFDPQNR